MVAGFSLRRAKVIGKGVFLMNTKEVSKLLCVSQSTIQRWVKQANLKMERNELGHYIFSEESIDRLRKIKEQVNNGMLLHEIAAVTKRQGKVKTEQPDQFQLFSEKLASMEEKLDSKADEVVTYQLLQHRREIEELHDLINVLTEKVEELNARQEQTTEQEKWVAASKEKSFFSKFRKKSIISSFFGL